MLRWCGFLATSAARADLSERSKTPKVIRRVYGFEQRVGTIDRTVSVS